MTNRIRFTFARQVPEAFPAAADDLGEVPENVAPVDHVKALMAEGKLRPAMLFAALTLPKRESVWWGCLCIRGLRLDNPKLREGLDAAEKWVREPEEEQRRAAGKIAEAQKFAGPGAWIAFAAFTSGGSLVDAGMQTVPPPPDACGRAVNAAIVLAVSEDDPRKFQANMHCALDSFCEFAAGGDGKRAWTAGPKVARPQPG